MLGGPRQLRSIVLAAVLGAAPLAAASTPPAVIEPAHHLVFPAGENLHSLAISPDGTRAYVHLHVQVLDLWGLAVSRWPELLGGFVALLMLVALLALVRVRRRPQRRGVPYCRRCNYDLSGHARAQPESGGRGFVAAAGARCPECGTDLASRVPRAGRSARRRLLAPVLPAAAAAAAYAVMLGLGLPRQGWAGGWFSWRSAGLAGPAESLGWRWLTEHIQKGERVLELELASGRVTRTVYTRGSASYHPLAISPDGAVLYTTQFPDRAIAGDRSKIVAISARTGRVLARAPLPGAPGDGTLDRAVIGFADGGASVLVQCVDEDAGVSRVVSWAPASGDVRVLVETPAYVDHSSGRRAVWGRKFALRGGEERPRFLSIPNFMEAFPTRSFQVRLHAETGELERTIELGQSVNPSGVPLVTPDGRLAFLPKQLGVLGLDLGSGESAGELALSEGVWDEPALTADGRLLLVGVHGGRVRVRDIVARRWIAELRHPTELFAPHPVASADGSWVGAVCQKSLPNTGTARRQWTHEIVLWDLRAAGLFEAAGPSAEPE